MQKLAGTCIAAMVLSAALSGCGDTKVTESAATETASAQSVDSPTTGEADTQPSEPSPAVDPQVVSQRLAKEWGFDGYIRCGYYSIMLTAASIKSNDENMIALSKGMVATLGGVKPLVNPVPDDSLIGPALRMYQMEHMHESASQVSAEMERCAGAMNRAMTA